MALRALGAGSGGEGGPAGPSRGGTTPSGQGDGEGRGERDGGGGGGGPGAGGSEAGPPESPLSELLRRMSAERDARHELRARAAGAHALVFETPVATDAGSATPAAGDKRRAEQA
eukprot:5730173-Pleurochrysis_carterae.AAC.1